MRSASTSGSEISATQIVSVKPVGRSPVNCSWLDVPRALRGGEGAELRLVASLSSERSVDRFRTVCRTSRPQLSYEHFEDEIDLRHSSAASPSRTLHRLNPTQPGQMTGGTSIS